MLRAVLATAVLLVLTGPGEARFETDQRIAGIEVSCRDVRGSDVRIFKVSNLGDVGRASVINRVPVIVLDTEILQSLPPKMQLFFYEHECAHHALGHWFSFAPDRETEADCWAIKSGRDAGLFTREDVAAFAPWLAGSKGSPWGHLPGPQRARHLLACFDER